MSYTLVMGCLEFLLNSLATFITGNPFVLYVLGVLIAGLVIKLLLYMLKGGRRWEI